MSNKSALVSASRSHLLLVDLQAKLLPAMAEAGKIQKNCERLLSAAGQLEVTIAATEQYPRGLGPTIPELRDKIDPQHIIEKTTFSAAQEPGGMHILPRDAERDQIIITGIEAHVCVLQTALDLAESGKSVFVVEDAIGSRTKDSLQAALRRLSLYGIPIVTTEMVIFEWLRSASHPSFRELSAMIR